jgi:hypothetical protein
MRFRFALRAARAPWWALLLVGCGGCSDKTGDHLVPPAETARQALEAGLKAWQNGGRPERLEGGPAVEVVDTLRRPGQKLKKFTVLGEVPGDGPRCFAVRLHLEAPAEEQRVRFVLVGIDPVWVFRYEDYEMLAHWECGAGGRPRAAKAGPTQ